MRHQCHFSTPGSPSSSAIPLPSSVLPPGLLYFLQGILLLSSICISLLTHAQLPTLAQATAELEQWLWPSKDRNGRVHALPNLAASLHLCCIVFFFWPSHPLWIPFPSHCPAFMGSLFFPTAVAGGGCRCGLETWAATAPQPTSSSLSSATCTPMGARARYSLQPHKDHTPPFSAVDQRRALNL